MYLVIRRHLYDPDQLVGVCVNNPVSWMLKYQRNLLATSKYSRKGEDFIFPNESLRCDFYFKKYNDDVEFLLSSEFKSLKN